MLEESHIPYILAFHLLTDKDPDPGYHSEADPDPAFHFGADPDPAYQFDADPDPDNILLF